MWHGRGTHSTAFWSDNVSALQLHSEMTHLPSEAVCWRHYYITGSFHVAFGSYLVTTSIAQSGKHSFFAIHIVASSTCSHQSKERWNPQICPLSGQKNTA